MVRKAKLGDEDVEFLEKADLDTINKRLDDILKEVKSKQQTLRSEQFCPDCHVATDDIVAHLKADPEKHGLVKTVEKEVVKEVPKKRNVSEILSEHDFIDCPDCRKVIDEHLSKKGLEITKKKEEEEGEVYLI